MKHQFNNYVFIDGQNLHLAVRSLGWRLDYRRFRRYLAEKYGATKVYLFLGFLEEQADLYRSLQESGYVLIFKPTLRYRNGKIKGNCDAELVFQAMIDYDNYNKAIIVTGDGDFHCLVRYFIQQDKLNKVLVPNQKHYSALLKRIPSQYLAFVSDLRQKLEYKGVKKKRTPQGQNLAGRSSS